MRDRERERGGHAGTSERWWFPIATIVTALLVVMTVVATLALHRAQAGPFAIARISPTPALQGGTDMQGHPAPAFALRDQHGAVITLAALHGHPVVLTFIDATCTEQCPLMIQYLNWAAQQFLTPQQVTQVTWVAISVNPHNTPAQVAAFLATNKPAMSLRFLLGTQAQLQPLWKAYYIEVQPGETDVAHTSGLYLIDQQGRERVWMDAGFDPKALASDLQTLLATPP